MPRFSGAFTRRKSAAFTDDFQNAQVAAPEQPSSFRVLERKTPQSGPSFDGGARLARAAGSQPSRPSQFEPDEDENLFAHLKNNRGSGASSLTKGASTDTSSRHSNASTAPSSADMATGNQDDQRNITRKPLQDTAPKPLQKSGSGFLNLAGRTFSFGGHKKQTIPPPRDEDVPGTPPMPRTQRDEFGRERAMTASTSSTATPPKIEDRGIDLGGDFSSVLMGFNNKRASQATLTLDGAAAPRSLTGQRHTQPAPLQLDTTTSVQQGPQSYNSTGSGDNLLGQNATSPDFEQSPTLPLIQRTDSPASYKASGGRADGVEDEDAKLLQDSLLAGRYLIGSDNPTAKEPSTRYRRNEDRFDEAPRRPIHSSFTRKDEDNLFEGSLSRFNRVASRHTSKQRSPAGTKVMTPAQFEQYRQDKEREGLAETRNKMAGNSSHAAADDDDDEDEINYDDDEDEAEKNKQQTRLRRKQEANMAVYRQQMMKVTGETPMPSPPPQGRPSLPTSMSAPQLNLVKAPSPDPGAGPSDEDDDDDVPLAILQAHGFPHKSRPPTRLSTMGSNPNLRASAKLAPPPNRPSSAAGDGSTAAGGQRHSALPAFARNLPQDPFIGASLSRPAMRETLSFGGGSPARDSGGLPPGGLVGVIAHEERSKAMRRGSPNVENQRAMPAMHGHQGPPFDPMSGIPHHMMYGNGAMPGAPPMPAMPGMMHPQMPPQMLSAGDQAQIQMTQQMQQFMQMQMQFMHMMSGQQQQAQQQPPPPGMMPHMQPPMDGGISGSQTMGDMSGRQSAMGGPMMDPRPMSHGPMGMRAMSMMDPGSGAFMQQPGYASSVRGGSGHGYTPSIAPSERSNVGLPGRYQPVSAPPAQPPTPSLEQRSSTMSGALESFGPAKHKSTMTVTKAAYISDDDDDDEGWAEMKAKRDKKKSQWREKKTGGNELSAVA